MKSWPLAAISLILVFLLGHPRAYALEKVTYGVAAGTYYMYYMPPLAAEEKGFWKERGLQVEWVSFQAGTPLNQAVVAGSVNMGGQFASSFILAASRGVPTVIVSTQSFGGELFAWVRADSPIRDAKDLKGARFGIGRFGGAEHASSRAMAKALGFADKVKYVTTGGIGPSIALLRAGQVDVIFLGRQQVIMLELAGQVRRVVSLWDFMPKDFVTLFSHKGYSKSHLETVKKVVQATLKATDFIKRSPEWSIEKLKARSGYTTEAATAIYQDMVKEISKDGKIDVDLLSRIRGFSIEQGLVQKEKVLPVEELYAREFTE